MSVKHLKYTNNTTGETVRAIKVTEKNFKRIADWINETDASVFHKLNDQAEALCKFDKKVGDFSEQRVRVRTRKGFRVAVVGEFVVREGDYDPKTKTSTFVFRVGKDEFEREFTKAS